MLPDFLIDPVIRLRNRGDSHSSTVSQTRIERLLTADDVWSDHVVFAANAIYRERASILVDELHEQIPVAFDTTAPEAVCSSGRGLPTTASTRPRCASGPARSGTGQGEYEGVVYQHGEFFASSPQRQSERYLRFAYGDRTPDELREAVRRLAQAI